MSLEHALLDRLEKRSLQIAQQKNEIYGLRQLVDEKMTINEQLSEQITSARLEREQMQHQIAELKTERDRILEISKNLVPKSALKQAMLEAAELHGALNDAQGEIQNLRAEVPLESTREALKNAVAKLQEVTTEKDRMRLQLENARADLKQALVERDSLGSMAADRVMEIRKLMDGHAEDMKAQAELTAQLDSTKGEAEEWLKQCHAARRQRDEVREEARKETQRLSDLCAELQSKEAVTAARENGIHKGESLSGFIWRQCESLRKSQAENAPLNKLFVVLCKQRGNLNEEIIYRAVDEASNAIKKLTA